MEKVLGIDVSRYQGEIDWDIVSNHDPKIIFVGIRATLSWGYQDPWFPRNWQEAKRIGVLRTAYHVIFPGEDPTRQIDNLFRLIGDDHGELPLVLDIELDQGNSVSTIINNIYKQAQLVEVRDGRKPILYSRASWVDQYMKGATWLNEYDWWIAHYLTNQQIEEHPGPPALPKGVSTWLIHQTSGKFITNGQFGVESKEVDIDRWNTTNPADIYHYAGIAQPETPEVKTWPQAIDAWARTQGYTGPEPD